MSIYTAKIRVTFALAVAFFASCLVATAVAQQYQSDPVDEKVRRHGAKATQWARDSSAYANDKATFIEYFQKYYFPAMTRTTPQGLAELGKLRTDLVKKFLWDSSNEQLKQDLTEMAYKSMARIVGRPYHPAARYNAVLILGLLDDQYAIDAGANQRPPKPHAGANKALTIIVSDATGDRFPPPVVLGALVGLERHARYSASLPQDQVAAMTTALMKFVNNEKPIQGMDPDAHGWLRLRAATALANLGTVGPNNAVHDAIVKMIATTESLDDRCMAAALLGKLNYENAKIDAAAATGALFKLASDVSEAELKRANEFEQVGSMSGVTSRITANADEMKDSYPRNHLLARLINLRTGLAKIKSAVPEDSQKQIDAVVAAVNPVIKAASDEKTISLRVAFLVRQMNGELEQLVGSSDEDTEEGFDAGAPAPAAQPAPDQAPEAAAPPAGAAAPPAAPAAPEAATPPAE